MKSIPLHDATVPIVCIADGVDIPVRLAQVERMRAALTGVDRTEHGLLLRFPNEPAIEADVRDFTIEEKHCCGFWGFAIATTPDEIKLRWDGPPAVDAFIDRLLVYFRGDEPITAEVLGIL